MLSEDELRRLYASRPAPDGGHVDDATFEALACGELDDPSRAWVADHVSRCVDCALVQRGLLLLAAEASAFDPHAPGSAVAPSVSRRARWLVWGAGLVAVTLTAIGVVWLVPRASERPQSQLRGIQRELMRPMSPEGALPSAPQLLSWAPMPGATDYEVQLFSEDGTELWRSGPKTDTKVAWPVQSVSAAGVCFWQVTARADGQVLGRSSMLRITWAAH